MRTIWKFPLPLADLLDFARRVEGRDKPLRGTPIEYIEPFERADAPTRRTELLAMMAAILHTAQSEHTDYGVAIHNATLIARDLLAAAEESSRKES